MSRFNWSNCGPDTLATVEQRGGKRLMNSLIAQVVSSRQTTQLGTLTQGISGSLVLRVLTDGHAAGVIKIDDEAKVGAEYKNYLELAHALHPGSVALFPLATHAPSPKGGLSALLYRSVGHQTIGEYVRECVRVGKVEDASKFILNALEAIETVGSPDQWVWRKLCSRGCYYLPTDAISVLTESREVIGNLFDVKAAPLQPTLTRLTHGDFHTENILITHDGSISLIDFGMTGTGHFFRDPVTLEAHLIFRALAPSGQVDDHTIRQYWETIEPLYVGTFLPVRPTAAPLQLVREMRLHVKQDRMNAHRSAYLGHGMPASQPEAEYLFGVLRHTVRLAGRKGKDMSEGQRWLATRAASSLAARFSYDRRRGAICLTDGPVKSSSFETSTLKLADLPNSPSARTSPSLLSLSQTSVSNISLSQMLESLSLEPLSDPFLVFVYGGYSGSVVTLNSVETTIGRSWESDLQIDHTSVSRMHAKVTRTDSACFIEDLGSTNGTFVGRERLVAPHELVEQEVLTIGKNRLMFGVSRELLELLSAKLLYERG